jgi:two-component system chemotaxis response regulator CheY
MDYFLNSLFVLLVEPSIAQRHIITNQLDELGITEYQTVSNGQEALAVIDQEQPDLVISAMFLEDMTGTDLVLEMRENPISEDTPFMLISTVTSFKELDPILQAGASAVLPKPFGAAELKRAIRTTLAWENPDELNLQPYDPAGLRILLVDDSVMARHLISRTLSKMGVSNVTEAADGREAAELMQQGEFDLVITDYNMPEMDGHELLKFIRRESNQQQIPVLMVTTEGDESKLSAVQHEGVAAIIDKPFEVTSVKQLIESIFTSA